jgi:hypothetical protein
MKRIAFILMFAPLMCMGQHKLFLENHTSGKTIKIKKGRHVVCKTLADKRFSGDVKNYTASSMTLKVIRRVDGKNGYTDTVISYADISKLIYARHPESSFRSDVLFYGAVFSALSLIGGTAMALSSESQGMRQTGFIFVGAGLLLGGGVLHGLINTGATEYDLISDWKIRTK